MCSFYAKNFRDWNLPSKHTYSNAPATWHHGEPRKIKGHKGSQSLTKQCLDSKLRTPALLDMAECSQGTKYVWCTVTISQECHALYTGLSMKYTVLTSLLLVSMEAVEFEQYYRLKFMPKQWREHWNLHIILFGSRPARFVRLMSV